MPVPLEEDAFKEKEQIQEFSTNRSLPKSWPVSEPTSGADLISVQKKLTLENLVRRVRRNPRLAESLRSGQWKGMNPRFPQDLNAFIG